MNSIICDIGFSKDNIDYFGNKYLVGNGYMGIRGTLEEYSSEWRPAINLSGVYDQVPGKWRESVNAPNPLYIKLYADGEELSLPERTPEYHEQTLSLGEGISGRRTVYQLGNKNITVTSERFASMDDVNTVWMRYTVYGSAETQITLYSGIDCNVWDINGPHFVSKEIFDEGKLLSVTAITGEQNIDVKVSELVVSEIDSTLGAVLENGKLIRRFEFTLEANKEYVFDKHILVETSKDASYPRTIPEISYDEAKSRHIARWNKIWNISEVIIDGDPDAMLAINYSIYHLNCVAPRHSDSMSIPARGLSGQVYKGAVFWDTEMFMFDYFLFTDPKVARTFVKYRIDTLAGAEKKAAEYDYDGAFYAWESHEGGIDACTDYNITDVFTGRPTRTYFRDKQVHVSAAMVYALVRYIDVTGDKTVLTDGGDKMLLQCARFYYSLLLKRATSDKYEIHDVVGPDEYHERVNNNAYTNRMAKFTLEKAAELLCGNNICDENELLRFKNTAKSIKLQEPDAKTGLIEQFDGYFKLEDASVEEVRSRLLDPKEYWGGANGVASHTQVNKQADVAAMLGMFPDDYSREIKEKNWLYYEPRTEHGSSLSACMFALVACQIGRPDYAYPLFMKSAEQDLKKSSKLWLGLIFIGGTHPAAQGGAWMVASRGFAGVGIKNGQLKADKPALPGGWKKLSLKMICGGKTYSVVSDRENTVITEV